MNALSPVQILLVEDSPSDVILTREALHDGKLANDLFVVGDGEAALSFLHRQGEYAGSPRPDLMLLDLNLPGKDGMEVLAEVKADEDLRKIPVIVLTTSAQEDDVIRAYDRYVNAYVKKPMDITRFMEVVCSVEDFYVSIVRLPAKP